MLEPPDASPALIDACNAATAITLPAITSDAVSVNQTGTVGTGAGNFVPSEACVMEPRGSAGAETIYSVQVPTGLQVDLLVTSEQPGTADTDTIVYIRSECVDGTTELACNDDRASGDLQSDLEARNLGPGTYFVFVEAYGGVPTGTAPFELQVTARPVLASGATCDDAEVRNRCAGAPCSGGTCP